MTLTKWLLFNTHTAGGNTFFAAPPPAGDKLPSKAKKFMKKAGAESRYKEGRRKGHGKQADTGSYRWGYNWPKAGQPGYNPAHEPGTNRYGDTFMQGTPGGQGHITVVYYRRGAKKPVIIGGQPYGSYIVLRENAQGQPEIQIEHTRKLEDGTEETYTGPIGFGDAGDHSTPGD